MKKTTMLLSVLLVILILPLLITIGNAKTEYTFNYFEYTYGNTETTQFNQQEPSESNSFRHVFYDGTLSSDFDIIIDSDLYEPPIDTKYNILQLYFDYGKKGNYGNRDLNELNYDFYITDGITWKYKGIIDISFNIDTIVFHIKNYLYEGGWVFDTESDFFTFNFTDNNIETSEVRNLELSIHIFETILGSQYISLGSYISISCNDVIVNERIPTSSNFIWSKAYELGQFKRLWIGTITNSISLFKINQLVGVRAIYHYVVVDYYIPTTILQFPSFWNDLVFETAEPTETYWTYTSFKLTESSIIDCNIRENITFLDTYIDLDFSYEFTTIEGKDFVARYYYSLTIIKNGDLGDWGLNNWLRNGLVAILNALIFFGQFLCYLLVVGLNWLFGPLFIVIIIPFLYNIVLFYLLLALVWILFWLCVGIILLADILVDFFLWLSTDVLYPFFVYLVEDVFPVVVVWIIIIIAWIIAIFLYILCIGQVDIVELELVIESFLEAIAEFMFMSTAFIITYLPELLMYLIFYLVLIGFCFLKLTYVKARGFVNRSSQLNASLEAYVVPIQLGYNIVLRIKNLIVGWL